MWSLWLSRLRDPREISTVVRARRFNWSRITHYGTEYQPDHRADLSDLSLFTCDQKLGRDATKVFQLLVRLRAADTLDN